MGSITINAQLGSHGGDIAKRLSDMLGVEILDMDSALDHFLEGKVQKNIISLLKQSPKAFLTDSPFDCSFQEYLEGMLRDKAKRESYILVNFGGAQFLRDDNYVMHVKVVGSLKERAQRLSERNRINNDKAETELLQSDRKYQRYLNTLFGLDAEREGTYDIVVSTDRASVNGILKVIDGMYQDLQTQIALLTSNAESQASLTMSKLPEMKNESEIDFAYMLDMYHIDWRYEPKTFPIEWDDEGRVTLAFSPDFYLPKFNLYLELTTMNQKYVTMKNKKAKKVREMYPGVNVRIVYKKDFANMMERFAEA